MYEKGEGGKQDYSKALSYYEQAGENGHKKALYNLGLMYEFGKGVDRDYDKARAYYKQAAEIGGED